MIIKETRSSGLASAGIECATLGELIHVMDRAKDKAIEVIEGHVNAAQVRLQKARLDHRVMPVFYQRAASTGKRDAPRITIAADADAAHDLAVRTVDEAAHLVELPRLQLELRRRHRRRAKKPRHDGFRRLPHFDRHRTLKNERGVVDAKSKRLFLVALRV
ncbi:hypothetical protein [Dyella sp.]|uniref:hypothetical protein n=1 Tax=Dyella sp. TaxID=1869338 RepID=UPI00284A04E5|nr:hypothetical protein [Dyella sp.]MDR3447410.1 hypothetical protein [Dyella sp.]